MSGASIDIELVVREVLAELRAAPTVDGGRGNGDDRGLGTSVPSAVPSKVASSNEQSKINDQQPTTLLVPSRVVTMEDVLGRLASVRRVVVRREALVTPAVRDELLRRGIALEYADAAGDRPAAIRLVVATTGTDFDPAALLAGLGREGFRAERFDSDCLIAATDQLAQEVAQADTLGVLLSPYVAAGLCMANRLSRVRAIGGGDAPAVAAAAAAVGANLLVADPRAGSFFQLKQMVAEFARGGVRPCPAVFRERLA